MMAMLAFGAEWPDPRAKHHVGRGVCLLNLNDSVAVKGSFGVQGE